MKVRLRIKNIHFKTKLYQIKSTEGRFKTGSSDLTFLNDVVITSKKKTVKCDDAILNLETGVLTYNIENEMSLLDD